MKAFRFPLDRVLQWRATQCDLEETATARLISQREQLQSQLEQIGRYRQEASEVILAEREVDSVTFQTVANFHRRIAQLKSRTEANAKSLEAEIAAQMIRTADARRKKRLLETLRGKKLQNWTALQNAENEQAAADSWLTKFAAERYTTSNATPDC